MMNYAYDTSLQETMILTEAFHTDRVICDNGSLYKFIWVQEGKLTLIVDHVEIEMEQDEIISVSNLHRTEFKNVSGRYLALLFNENFYGIYKHEKEVSCSGVLFNGTSGIVHLRLPIADSELLHEVVDRMVTEYILRDNLQGEMLRLLLKRFIILCTRLARKQLSGFPVNEKGFDIIQRYYVLVDNHFKEKKQVQALCCFVASFSQDAFQFICRLRYAFPFEDYTRTSGDRSETAVAAYLAQHQRDIGDFGL